MRTAVALLVAIVGGWLAWFLWSVLPVTVDDFSALHVVGGGGTLLVATGIAAAIAGGAVRGVISAVVALVTFSIAWVVVFGAEDESGLYVVGLLFFLIMIGWAVVLMGLLVGRRFAPDAVRPPLAPQPPAQHPPPPGH